MNIPIAEPCCLDATAARCLDNNRCVPLNECCHGFIAFYGQFRVQLTSICEGFKSASVYLAWHVSGCKLVPFHSLVLIYRLQFKFYSFLHHSLLLLLPMLQMILDELSSPAGPDFAR